MPELPPVYIIEDNEDDIILFQHLLDRCGLLNKLVPFSDLPSAQQIFALHMFAGRKEQIPLLLFSDMHMPIGAGLSGLSTIEWVKSTPELKDTKIVILSGSSYDKEMQEAVRAGANIFVEKFPAIGKLQQILRDAGCTCSELRD